jgi:hypothetical protein
LFSLDPRVTARDLLDRKIRRAVRLSVIGFALFAGGGFIASQHPNSAYAVIPLLGFAAFGAAVLYGWLAVRCPFCSKPIGSIAMRQSPFFTSARFRYCPYCGRDLEAELDASSMT